PGPARAGGVRLVPVRALALDGRRMELSPFAGSLAPEHSGGWALRGALVRRPRRLPRAVGAPDGSARASLRRRAGRGLLAPGGRAERPAARLPHPLRGAHRARLAAVRRSLRAVRRRQPGDPAERPGREVAAALAASLRARDLPPLPGSRRDRRPPAGAH